MKKNDKHMVEESNDMRTGYAFANISGGIRGKYAKGYPAGANVVVLDPDVAKAFPTGESINEALRLLIEIAARGTPNPSE